jgi:ketopantoate reductase
MSTTQAQKDNVLLFGLGGIGGVYACILHLSGKCNVHVVARSNYEAVKSKGFMLVSPKFGDHDDIKFAGGESHSSYLVFQPLEAWSIVTPIPNDC